MALCWYVSNKRGCNFQIKIENRLSSEHKIKGLFGPIVWVLRPEFLIKNGVSTHDFMTTIFCMLTLIHLPLRLLMRLTKVGAMFSRPIVELTTSFKLGLHHKILLSSIC